MSKSGESSPASNEFPRTEVSFSDTFAGMAWQSMATAIRVYMILLCFQNFPFLSLCTTHSNRQKDLAATCDQPGSLPVPLAMREQRLSYPSSRGPPHSKPPPCTKYIPRAGNCSCFLASKSKQSHGTQTTALKSRETTIDHVLNHDRSCLQAKVLGF